MGGINSLYAALSRHYVLRISIIYYSCNIPCTLNFILQRVYGHISIFSAMFSGVSNFRDFLFANLNEKLPHFLKGSSLNGMNVSFMR